MEQRDQHRNRLIFLAGFMGSGKSTVGPILANTLGFEFSDIDRLIEEKAGLSIREIFARRGEEAFRALEREVLTELSDQKDRVVALGGGTIANEENFRLIREHGIVVYLQLPAEQLVHRVRHKNDRPMLEDEKGNTLSGELLKERVEHLLRHRKHFYERADVVIAAENQKVGVTVDEIVRNLRRLMKV